MKMTTVVLAGFLMLATSHSLHAQVSHQWNSTSPALWGDASNWNPNGVPGSLDEVVFDLPSGNLVCQWNAATPNTETAEVSIEAGTRFNYIGTAGATHTTQLLSISSSTLILQGVNLNLDDDIGTFHLIEGGIVVDGSHPAGSAFFGNGSIGLNSTTMHAESGGTVSVNDLIAGTGTLVFSQGLGSMIDASNFQIGGSSFASVHNSGTISATNVEIDGSSFLNIDTDGQVNITNRLTVLPGGSVNMLAGNLDVGELGFEELSSISGLGGIVSGLIFNNEFIDVQALPDVSNIVPDTSNVFVVNGGILTGSATLDLSVSNGNEIRLFAGDLLRIVADNGGLCGDGDVNLLGGTLEVTGEFVNDGFVNGFGAMFVGDGIFNESAFALSGRTDIFGDVVNNNQIVTSAAGTTVFYGDVHHSGTEIRTSAGSDTTIFGAATGGGSYTGTGTIYFEGDLHPGESPAQVQFGGDVVLGTSAVTHIELAGTLPGQFDQLLISGDISVNGTLIVSAIDSFNLQLGQEFEIVNVGGIATGQFAGLNEGSLVENIGGVDLFISYLGGDGNDIVLVTSGSKILVGDVNLDGVIDLLDVAPFIDRLSTGTYQLEADINGDGVVNLLDVAPFVNLLSGG